MSAQPAPIHNGRPCEKCRRAVLSHRRRLTRSRLVSRLVTRLVSPAEARIVEARQLLERGGR